MNDILWPKLVAAFIAPPGIIIIVGILGLFIMIWRRWLGAIVMTASIISLFVLSVPLVGKRFMMQLEEPYRPKIVTAEKHAIETAQAIVILGGGRSPDAPEYGMDTVSAHTLERLRYGARLARKTGLPVLLSGGSVFGEPQSEATLMQHVLENDFGVKAKWIERNSRNTLENAYHSKQMLSEAGIRNVYLVTHASHMARAQWAFVNAGLNVTPAPMGFTIVGKEDLSPLGYVPSANGLRWSTLALRERLGYHWYKRKRDAAMAAEAVKSTTPAK